MFVLNQIERLKKEELGLITVLTGEDMGQYQLAKAALLQQLGYDSSDLTYAYFDMAEVDYAQVELELLSLPFFADEKVVIMDNCIDISTAKKRHLSDEALKQFESYLEVPNETTRLIVCVPGKLDSKRRLVKLLKRDALILEATPLKEQEMRVFFTKESQRLGLMMSSDVLESVLIKSNMDFATTFTNLQFLQAYKPNTAISQEDVVAALPKTLQDNLFDLMQLILQRKVDAMNQLVHDLRLQGEDEVKLLAILLNQFRLFLQVKLLARDSRSEAQIVADLSDLLGRGVNPYQVKFALRDSRSLSVTFLEKVVSLLIETDYQIKSGFYQKDYLFDLALLKIVHMRS